MDNTKSLVESKAFWSSLLALLAIVFKAFHMEQAFAWAADPSNVDTIMTVIGGAGAIFAIAFRASATKQITSVMPAPVPPAVKSLAVIGLLLVGGGLAGCAQFTQDLGIVTGATISPTAVIVTANAFDGLEATATTYLKLPACPTATKICRAPESVPGIVKAVRAGRTARNTLEALLAANGNAAIPVASYNTLTAAVSSLQSIFATYNVAVVSAN